MDPAGVDVSDNAPGSAGASIWVTGKNPVVMMVRRPSESWTPNISRPSGSSAPEVRVGLPISSMCMFGP